MITFSASVLERLRTLNPSRRKSTVDNFNKDFNTTHGEQTCRFDYSLGAVTSEHFDSTSPKKSFLIMKALFEVESNSKGITFFPLKL